MFYALYCKCQDKIKYKQIKHCFEKYGFSTDDYLATAQDSDEEFETLFNEISENCSIDKYAEVDNAL